MLNNLFTTAAGLLLAASIFAGPAQAATIAMDYTLTVRHWGSVDSPLGTDAYNGEQLLFSVDLTLDSLPLRIADGGKVELLSAGNVDFGGAASWDDLRDNIITPPFSPRAGFEYRDHNSLGVAHAVIWSSNSWALHTNEMSMCAVGSNGVACGDLTLGAPEVAAVPVPPAIFLLGTGLLALLGFARKTSKKA